MVSLLPLLLSLPPIAVVEVVLLAPDDLHERKYLRCYINHVEHILLELSYHLLDEDLPGYFRSLLKILIRH